MPRCSVWPRIGTDDDFFALGGDSIRSIQVASRATAQGIAITPREIFQHRSVTELAAMVDAGSRETNSLAELEGGGVGWLPLPPIARYLQELGGSYDRFSMSTVVDLPIGIDADGLTRTLAAVCDRHDALRSTTGCQQPRRWPGWLVGRLAADPARCLRRPLGRRLAHGRGG